MLSASLNKTFPSFQKQSGVTESLFIFILFLEGGGGGREGGGERVGRTSSGGGGGGRKGRLRNDFFPQHIYCAQSNFFILNIKYS